jgi:hypothetical protein
VRFKALVTAILFVAGVAASVAVAKGPPPGRGKDKDKREATTTSSTGSTSTETACSPKVAVILKGDFVSGSGSEDEGVFQMKVRQANKHGKRHVAETVTIRYDETTKFRRRGHAELDDFEAGDRLNVQARACKERKAKKPKKPKDGGTTGSTTTATTSTGTTATGTTPGAAPLLARRVTGSPAKAAGTTTGATTSTGP